MGKGENKHCSVVSWADEVEKEEEEARSQFRQKQTPNPFGSARPREVVLQERGIDWRKLDQRLHQPSRTSFETQKEKAIKKNIAAPAELVVEKGKQVTLPSRSPPETTIGLYRRRVPQIPSSCYNLVSGKIFVPQLNHPPRLIPTNLSTGSSSLYKRDTGSRNAQHKTRIEPEKENIFGEPGADQFHRWNRMELDIRSGGHIDDQKIIVRQESNNAAIFGSSRREHERVRGQSRKAPYMVTKTREDQQSHGKSKNMNCDIDLVGKMLPESHRRRALVFLPDKSCLSADKKRDMKKNVHGNYGRDRVINGLVNSTSTEAMQQHGQRKRGHRDSGEEATVYQRNYNNKRVVADTEDGSWEKIKIENEWQSFPRRVVGVSIVDGDSRSRPLYYRTHFSYET